MSKEEDRWQSQFGDKYTDRNPKTVKEMDELHTKEKGITRTELTKSFLDGLEISNALEVGCNVGVALQILHNLGFADLYGIETNQHAINIAKESTKGKDIYVIKGSALDIPYKDLFFDLVYTNGLLVHISPDDINDVLDEIYRCAKRYIWGYEYYSVKYEEVIYRGMKGMLWKSDFANLFVDKFSDLKIVKLSEVCYTQHPELIDAMYLLEKK